MLLFLIPAFGDAVLSGNEYIKVIGITAALLGFGLINSVSAIAFPEPNDIAKEMEVKLDKKSFKVPIILPLFYYQHLH